MGLDLTGLLEHAYCYLLHVISYGACQLLAATSQLLGHAD